MKRKIYKKCWAESFDYGYITQRQGVKEFIWGSWAPIGCDIETRLPIWRDDDMHVCNHCFKNKHRSQFYGVEKRDYRCIPCNKIYVNSRASGVWTPKENLLAYTHVIRDRYDKTKLFKFSLLQGDIPKGYTVIYKGRAGTLLPKQYKGFPAYAQE